MMKTLDDVFRLDVEPLFLMLEFDPESLIQVMNLTVVNGVRSFNTITELLKFGQYATVAPNLVALRNKVAQQSRRGAGNYLFSNNKDFVKMDTLLRDFIHLNLMELVVCEDVPDGEVWSCYSKTHMSTNTEKYPIPIRAVMDGPFALFEDKLYINPKWDSYIVKWKPPCGKLTNTTLGKSAV